MKDIEKHQTVVLGLGSNLGDRLANMRQALNKLSPYVSIQSLSPVYETSAQYVTDQPPFLNAVVVGKTKFEPIPLLWSLRQLEMEIGRQPTFRYGPRLIDIDIIFYGDRILNSPELTIPHLKVAEREFVLRPLADIAPDFKHPKTGLSVEEMLERVPSSNPIRLDYSLAHAA